MKRQLTDKSQAALDAAIEEAAKKLVTAMRYAVAGVDNDPFNKPGRTGYSDEIEIAGFKETIKQSLAPALLVMLEEEASAAENALDDIELLACDAWKSYSGQDWSPKWEYPGQVVRDVCMAFHISLDRMPDILSKGKSDANPSRQES